MNRWVGPLVAATLVAATGAGGEELPLAVTPPMRVWLARQGLDRGDLDRGDAERRLARLWRRLLAADGLGLTEDPAATAGAARVFEERTADCVGFAHLFVALGREAGVPVFFVVFEHDFGSARRRDLRVVTGHLAAAVGDPARPVVFDFAGRSEPPPGAVRAVSDVTARAIYHANHGAQQLLSGELEAARRELERAVGLDAGLASAWVNLGVTLRRLGLLEQAIAAYRRAFELAPGSPEAFANLEALALQLAAGAPR